MSTPRTYTAALKVAELVTLDEFRTLLSEQRYASVITARKSIKHATSPIRLREWDGLRTPFVGFGYLSSRSGTDRTGVARLNDSIFDFYNIGRIVRVECAS